MSVICYSEDELTAIGRHVLALCSGPFAGGVLAERVREMTALLGDGHTPEEVLVLVVGTWLQSVSVANQAAYAATYRRESVPLVFYGFAKLERGVAAAPATVFQELGSLSYNVISNGGRRWLCHEDEEVLDRLRLAAAYRLVEVHQ